MSGGEAQIGHRARWTRGARLARARCHGAPCASALLQMRRIPELSAIRSVSLLTCGSQTEILH
ncbi:unnamed protein product [Chondrus crispus]|uniref:Uncharacterized protein n=1 Tax=Chondrus crispus TaxID=2769 RepID=R7Q8A9_CHOCR|nr:unnamed protein product [Chondrus crispus]CDF33616.1 unnamed protein product [Chondrus crispus]|eukprot:XP_005713419.1 unnamed protein product [Chondrus crispus]